METTNYIFEIKSTLHNNTKSVSADTIQAAVAKYLSWVTVICNSEYYTETEIEHGIESVTRVKIDDIIK